MLPHLHARGLVLSSIIAGTVNLDNPAAESYPASDSIGEGFTMANAYGDNSQLVRNWRVLILSLRISGVLFWIAALFILYVVLLT